MRALPPISECRALVPAAPPVRVIAALHPFKMERLDGELPHGFSYAQILEIVQPDPRLRQEVRIYVADYEVVSCDWEMLPPPGALVRLKAAPRAAIGAAIAAIAALIAGAATTAALGGTAAVVFTIGSFAVTAGMIGGLVSMAVSMVGMLLLSALAPPPPQQNQVVQWGGRTPVFSIEGSRNSIEQYGAVPMILGRYKYTPKYAALPYTVIFGVHQYLHAIFNFGYGPVELSDIKIGETPIWDYPDVTVEARYGYDTDDPLTLYPSDVYEEGMNVKLIYGADWTVRTLGGIGSVIAADISFPGGLIGFGPGGAPGDIPVDVEVEAREAGTSDPWTRLTSYCIDPLIDPFNPTEKCGLCVRTIPAHFAVRHANWWTMPKVARWEMRFKRTTHEGVGPLGDYTQYSDDCFLIATRTINGVPPLNMTGLALLAVKIRASEQLSGILENLSAVAQGFYPDYDAATDTWITRATSNPASLYRYILQGRPNKRALADSRVNLDNLKYWHQFCADKGFEFNAVITAQTNVDSLLKMIAAAGRASPSRVDNKYGVVIDEPRTYSVMALTPRNSWDFNAEKKFVDLPHALKVQFANRDNDWKVEEMFVYRDGYDANNATTFESMELPGVTDADHAWKLARYHFAYAQLRPETYSLNTGLQHLVALRGDRVTVAHDVTLWGLWYPRVVSLTESPAGVVIDNTVTFVEGTAYKAKFWLADGTEIEKSVTVAAFGVEQDELIFDGVGEGPELPAAGDLVIIGEVDLVSVNLIVAGLEPGQNLTARLTLVDESPEIYDADAGPIPAFDPRLTVPYELKVPIIDNLIADAASVYQDPSGVWRSKIQVIYHLQTGAGSFVEAVEGLYKYIGWTQYVAIPPQAVSGGLVIADVEYGKTYEVMLRSIDKNGNRSPYSPASQVLVKSAAYPFVPPPDVENLSVRIVGTASVLFWSPVDFYDQVTYEVRAGDNFNNGAFVGQTANTEMLLPYHDQTVTLWVAAYYQGRYSDNPASLTAYINVLNLNLVQEYNEKTLGFPGTLTDTLVDGEGNLILDCDTSIDDWADFDAVAWLDSEGGRFASGSWLAPTAQIIDLGNAWPTYDGGRAVNAELHFDLNFFPDPGGLDLVDDWPDVDARPDWDGNYSEFVRVEPKLLVSDDVDPQVYVEKPFIPGTYYGRFFRPQLILTTSSPEVTPAVDRFSWRLSLADVVQAEENVAVPDTGVGPTIEFFFAMPRITVTIIDAADGDRVVLNPLECNGFCYEIQLYNGASRISGYVNYVAVGIGY